MFINSQPKSQHMNPSFKNKAPLNPVRSSSVFKQVQIDLVTMEGLPTASSDDGYKYVLVVLDVFSRFIFLRPLKSKSSVEIASHLIQLFSDTGPPKRLQSDQGKEFKGAVEKLMKAFKVHIIHSRPYHPQSQGKVSH